MATELPTLTAEFLLSEVAQATGGALHGAELTLRGLSTDTRHVRDAQLFVALSGEHFDGHAFLAQALASGASALLVSDAEAVPEGAPYVLVPDTLVALGELARHHRRRLGTRVVAITGSAGKTTTKELVSDAFEAVGLRVLRTQGNLNNRIGLPLTLLGLSAEHDIAVVEMGTSEPGEIARLTHIAEPDVGVLTIIAAAHTLGLGSIEEVAAEKGAMLSGLHADAVAVVNGDDALARLAAKSTTAKRVIFFGRADDCEARLVSAELEPELSTLAVYELCGETRLRSLRLRLLGDAGAMNAAATLAVVCALDLDADATAAALIDAVPVPGRMCVVDPSANPLVIDDTYNSNPRSLELSLRAAAALAEARGGRLVAVLGDMLELGERSANEHHTVCAFVASLDARALVAVGASMAEATAGAADLLRGIKTTSVADSTLAAPAVRGAAEPRDVVLVKGSRGLRMERVLEALAAGGAV